MPDEDIEGLLKSLPVRTLPPAAEEEIVKVLRAAEARRPARWWARPIPAWQAAAACLLACAATWWFAGAHTRDRASAPSGTARGVALEARHPPPPKTLFVGLDEPGVFAERSSADRLDISRWQTLN